MLTPLPKGVQTKYLKLFFFHLPTTQVVHLELRISPRIIEKLRNGPNGVLRGLEETNSRKKHKLENLAALSLEVINVRSLKVTRICWGGGGG